MELEAWVECSLEAGVVPQGTFNIWRCPTGESMHYWAPQSQRSLEESVGASTTAGEQCGLRNCRVYPTQTNVEKMRECANSSVHTYKRYEHRRLQMDVVGPLYGEAVVEVGPDLELPST